MQPVPGPDEVRAQLARLDELDRKVVGGMVVLCMTMPEKIRDREWIAERFVQVATVAHGFAEDQGPATTADVERIRAYAQARMHDIMHAALLVFVRTAEDLRVHHGHHTFADAQAIVCRYLA